MRRLIRGQLLVELLIAFGLSSILLPTILTGFISGRSGKVQQIERTKALAYLKEAEEATRVFRDADWTVFAQNGTYHPEISVSGSTWILAPGTQDLEEFTRSIEISDLTPPDPSVKKITATVSWGTFASSVTSTMYLTRWKNVISPPQIATGTLTQQGFGDWCKPIGPSVTNVNLDRQGNPTTILSFEIDDGSGNKSNRIFAGTGANSSGPAFSNIKIQGNSPPSATWLGDYNGSPQIKVNGISADGRYAFLATDSKGVEILDLAAIPPPGGEYPKIGSFNPNGMKKAKSVYVVGNTGYVVTEDKFYIFSVSASRTTTSQVGVLALADGSKVVVDGGAQYAYVANSDINGELKIIDVHTNPGSPTVFGQANIDGGAGRDVFVNLAADRAYLVTAASATLPEFFIINIGNKASPAVVNGGTYDTNGMDPYGVSVVSGDRAVVVGSGGNEYQVFSIADDKVSSCPNEDSFLNIDSGVFAVSSLLQSDGHAYSYIATGDADAEIKIIEGGAGGAGGGGGTFESPIFDAGSQVIFNYFNVESVDPSGLTTTFQVAVSSDCTTFNYVGIAGSGLVPVSLNPGQCFRFKVTFSGAGPGVTSATVTVSINYSP